MDMHWACIGQWQWQGQTDFGFPYQGEQTEAICKSEQHSESELHDDQEDEPIPYGVLAPCLHAAWEALDPWLFLDASELGPLSQTCTRNSPAVDVNTPLFRWSPLNISDDLRERLAEGCVAVVPKSPQRVVVERVEIVPSGWPTFTQAQQESFEDDFCQRHGPPFQMSRKNRFEHMRNEAWKSYEEKIGKGVVT